MLPIMATVIYAIEAGVLVAAEKQLIDCETFITILYIFIIVSMTAGFAMGRMKK